MKKFHATRYGRDKIREVEVLGETDKFIIQEGFRGRKEKSAKESSWDIWADTWEACYKWLYERSFNEVSQAKIRLSTAEYDLRKIEALKLTRQMSPDQK